MVQPRLYNMLHNPLLDNHDTGLTIHTAPAEGMVINAFLQESVEKYRHFKVVLSSHWICIQQALDLGQEFVAGLVLTEPKLFMRLYFQSRDCIHRNSKKEAVFTQF